MDSETREPLRGEAADCAKAVRVTSSGEPIVVAPPSATSGDSRQAPLLKDGSFPKCTAPVSSTALADFVMVTNDVATMVAVATEAQSCRRPVFAVGKPLAVVGGIADVLLAGLLVGPVDERLHIRATSPVAMRRSDGAVRASLMPGPAFDGRGTPKPVQAATSRRVALSSRSATTIMPLALTITPAITPPDGVNLTEKPSASSSALNVSRRSRSGPLAEPSSSPGGTSAVGPSRRLLVESVSSVRSTHRAAASTRASVPSSVAETLVTPRRGPTRFVVAVPLMATPSLDTATPSLGVLLLYNDASSYRDVSVGHEDGTALLVMLQGIAAVVVAFLSRMRAAECARAAEVRALSLVAVVRSLAQATDMNALLLRIVKFAYSLLHADRISVFTVDARRGELVLAVSEDAAGYCIPFGVGIVGVTAATGRVINVADAYASPLFSRALDTETGYQTRQVLAVPITIGMASTRTSSFTGPGGGDAAAVPVHDIRLPRSRVVAVIMAINKIDGSSVFSDNDVHALTVVAETAGVAIEKEELLADALAEHAAREALVDVVRIIHDDSAVLDWSNSRAESVDVDNADEDGNGVKQEQIERAGNSEMESMTRKLVALAFHLLRPSAADTITLYFVDEAKRELYCLVPTPRRRRRLEPVGLPLPSRWAPQSRTSVACNGSDNGGCTTSVTADRTNEPGTLRVFGAPCGDESCDAYLDTRRSLVLRRFSLDVGIAAAVARSGTLVHLIADAFRDVRFNAACDDVSLSAARCDVDSRVSAFDVTFPHAHALLCVPIKLNGGGRTVAVLQAIVHVPPGTSSGTPPSFCETDEALLVAYASEVGSVLERRSLQLVFEKAQADEVTGDGEAARITSLLQQYMGDAGTGCASNGVGISLPLGLGASRDAARRLQRTASHMSAKADSIGTGVGGVRRSGDDGASSNSIQGLIRTMEISAEAVASRCDSSGSTPHSARASDRGRGYGLEAPQRPSHLSPPTLSRITKSRRSAAGSPMSPRHIAFAAGAIGAVDGASTTAASRPRGICTSSEIPFLAMHADPGSAAFCRNGSTNATSDISQPHTVCTAAPLSTATIPSHPLDGTSSNVIPRSLLGAVKDAPCQSQVTNGDAPLTISVTRRSVSIANGTARSWCAVMSPLSDTGARSSRDAAIEASAAPCANRILALTTRQESSMRHRPPGPTTTARRVTSGTVVRQGSLSWNLGETDSGSPSTSISCSPRGLSVADLLIRSCRFDFDALTASDDELLALPIAWLSAFGLDLTFRLDMTGLTQFVGTVRARYCANPYHNWRHAVSVTHVVFLALWRTRAAAEILEPIDRLAALLAALCHDVGHPGVNNAFESATLSARALTYNDTSVLEHHHSAIMFELLSGGEVTARGDGGEPLYSILRLPRPEYARFRRISIAAILATDMARHGELVDAARRLQATIISGAAAASVTAASQHGSLTTRDALAARILRPRSALVGSATGGLTSPRFHGRGVAQGAAGVSPILFQQRVGPSSQRTATPLINDDQTPRGVSVTTTVAADDTPMDDGSDAVGRPPTCGRAAATPLPQLPADLTPKLLVELIVHAADLSNPVLPAFGAVRTWAELVCTEFTAQAAAERLASLPVALHMEGISAPMGCAKLQLGFVDYVVAPLWAALTTPSGALLSELAEVGPNLVRNRMQWARIAEGATASTSSPAV